MNFEYDRLSKKEQELFRTSFEDAWETCRVKNDSLNLFF